MPKDPITTYIKNIDNHYKGGESTELSYRPAFYELLESLTKTKNIEITHEPKRKKYGSPDFILKSGIAPIGHIEAKDIGKSLDEIEKDAFLKNPKTPNGKQLKRYLESLNNIIFTDYLEFRWYVEKEKRLSVQLANLNTKGQIKLTKDGSDSFTSLINEFLEVQVITISTPKDLAVRMAAQASLIKDIIIRILTEKNEKGSLRDQLDSFKEVLLHSLTTEQFADMYAQTISYGLFAAKYNFTNNEPFTRVKAAYILPKTNPFLRKLFGQMAGPEMDDRLIWAVDNLAELLNKTDIGAILKDFGKRTRREDPVVHFYETFLTEYDEKLRKVRGVYYTPEPVVSYIVRSVDHILKTEFKLKDGLADKSKIKYKDPEDKKKTKECHKVLILDPAVGTGTFLFNVIDHIHEAIVEKGQEGTWSEYVSDHLLPRLFGFELLIAPYTVAHMKLDLQLKDSKYKHKANERLNIFLTNSLEEAFPLKGKVLFSKFIAEEANEAGNVKQDLPVMVVLGNPPYSGHSENKGKWIKNLLRGKDNRTDSITENYFEVDGNPLGERNPKWLNDDYVKFIRFSQNRIEETGYGILAFITNHSYLDNPTFRGMRQSLMNTFDDIYILNLHGNSKKKEICPDGSKDENVFDIQQGVAIGIYIKKPDSKSSTKIKYKDLWGLREIKDNDKIINGKYSWLKENQINSTDWEEIQPQKPFYLFVPQDRTLLKEYNEGWKITEILKMNSAGIVTARDKLTIDFDNDKLYERIKDFLKLNAEEARQKYKLGTDARDWKIHLAQKDIKDNKINKNKICSISYRPFDKRFTFYTGKTKGFICMPRKEVMQHMLKGINLGLLWTRPMSPSYEFSIMTTKHIIDQCAIGNKSAGAGISYLGSLYLYPEEGMLELDEPSSAPGGRKPNLAPDFIKVFSNKIKLKFIPDGLGDLKKTFGPEDIFNYIYAVFHSPEYRKRYAEFLKIDFPRLPLTSKLPLFRKLCTLGSQLVELHLMEKEIDNFITKYPISGKHLIDKIRFTLNDKTSSENPLGKVWINEKQYFDNIPQDVWEFHIGGYQICQKWLKDRKGRNLTGKDIDHYQYIVMALNNTIKLMSEIDSTIEKHGGWPLS